MQNPVRVLLDIDKVGNTYSIAYYDKDSGDAVIAAWNNGSSRVQICIDSSDLQGVDIRSFESIGGAGGTHSDLEGNILLVIKAGESSVFVDKGKVSGVFI